MTLMPGEIEDNLSESDDDGREWQLQMAQRDLMDIVDVNEGEKAIMLAWNKFLALDYKMIGICQTREACMKFIDLYGKNLMRQNLRCNLILHFTNLNDFGMLSPEDVHDIVMKLYEIAETPDVPPQQISPGPPIVTMKLEVQTHRSTDTYVNTNISKVNNPSKSHHSCRKLKPLKRLESRAFPIYSRHEKHSSAKCEKPSKTKQWQDAFLHWLQSQTPENTPSNELM